VQRDLAATQESVAIEAWWWAGETAVALGEPAFLGTAEEWAGRLATLSDRPDEVRAAAGSRLDGWRLRLGRSPR
ncbi:MAG: hypothetical protein ACJ72L_01520, partial [Marmoricola sp.]